MNYFRKEISVYNGVSDNQGTIMSIGDFLFSKGHENTIKLLRHLSDKDERNAWKRRLPQATISGVFLPTRSKLNLSQLSGLICIDIDAKDNPDIRDWEKLKHQLAILPQVFYGSLSVSGNGIFVIIPLCYPDKHLWQFKQLQHDFGKMGIVIDAACSDMTRMRCMSYDEHPIINENAIPYEGLYIEPPKPKRTFRDYPNEQGILVQVGECCKQIQRYGIDITAGYDQWLKVGCSLATLGEDGRDFFHLCSQQNLGYNEAKTDKMFSDLLRRNYQSININTFFWICQQNGIKLFKNK